MEELSQCDEGCNPLSHPSLVSWNSAQPPVPPVDRSQSLSGIVVLAQQTPGLPPLAISSWHTGLCLSTARVLQMGYMCWTAMPTVAPGCGESGRTKPHSPDAIISLFSCCHPGMLDSLMPTTTRHSCQLCGHRGCGELVVMPPQWSGNCAQHAGVPRGMHPCKCKTDVHRVLLQASSALPGGPKVLGPAYPLALHSGEKGISERRSRDGRMPGRKEKGMRKKGREGSWKYERTKMEITVELGPRGPCQRQAALRLCLSEPLGLF